MTEKQENTGPSTHEAFAEWLEATAGLPFTCPACREHPQGLCDPCAQRLAECYKGGVGI